MNEVQIDGNPPASYGDVVRGRVYVGWLDNTRHFDRKLPTSRDGFCHIERSVTIEKAPHGTDSFWSEGLYGFIKANGKKVRVFRSEAQDDWQIA